ISGAVSTRAAGSSAYAPGGPRSSTRRRPLNSRAPQGKAMKLGVALPLAGDWATPENQITVAQRAEALGYHSLWVFQRLFYALAPQTDYPPMPGQPWPAGFRRVSDPIVTLAYVAGATTKIRLGTSVLITAYYTPIMLAKQLATLDRVSRGRLDVG